MYMRFFLVCFIAVSFFGCVMQGNKDANEIPEDNQTATVTFINLSKFDVDIYKNFNPEYFDITTFVCTVDTNGREKTVTLYASIDQEIGDTFYIRYKVPLADKFHTGTSDIYVDAQRDMSNISFVVEKSKKYEKTIPDIPEGQLNFVNGYLEIQNQSSSQVQITRGFELLHTMNDGGVYLASLAIGYYEIPFLFYDTTLTITQLKARGSLYIDFPSFVMKRNKKYSFVIKSDNTIEGPKEDDIVK